MKRIRLLPAIVVLGVAGGMLGPGATVPVSAATAAGRVSVPAHVPTVAIRATSAGTDPFPLVNANSSLCLNISGGGLDKDAIQYTCNNGSNETWHWESEYCTGAGCPVGPDGTGYYQLIDGDGACLGVAGGSKTEGARVVGWKCLGTGHPDQYWALGPNDGPWYTYWDYNSAEVLGVAGNSTANRAAVVQWGWQDNIETGGNQYWEPL